MIYNTIYDTYIYIMYKYNIRHERQHIAYAHMIWRDDLKLIFK